MGQTAIIDLGQIRSIPASARIQAALREQIVGMRLLPGAPLSEKEIAESHGVSRTPVREAMLRLAEERLVDIYPQYGTFVARIRTRDLKDAMVIREALERVSVREAAARATDEGLAELARLVSLQRFTDVAGDVDAFYAADEAFHEALARQSGHPNLWRVVRQEKAQLDRCRHLTLPIAGRRARVIEQHQAVVEAIVARDADAAEAAMAAHLADVLPSFEQLTLAHPDYFDLTATSARPPRAASRM